MGSKSGGAPPDLHEGPGAEQLIKLSIDSPPFRHFGATRQQQILQTSSNCGADGTRTRGLLRDRQAL
jgi:hypothetical protein